MRIIEVNGGNTMGFTKAVKTKAKLRVALGGKVALIDSERSSALLYAYDARGKAVAS